VRSRRRADRLPGDFGRPHRDWCAGWPPLVFRVSTKATKGSEGYEGSMADTNPTGVAEPEVGSYFVATYPPFSVWTKDAGERDATVALPSARRPGAPLGLYRHIPSCRKRCHFCYFRVYTDKNAQEI